MSTRSIISVDKKTRLGIYKQSDGYPSSTVPSILTYMALFGFVRFKKEIKRIGDKGGCSFFYYVSYITKKEYRHGFEEMLETEKITDDLFDGEPSLENVENQEYGYLVSSNEMTIFHPYSKTEKTIRYNNALIRHLIVEGLFEGNIEQPFINKFRLKD